jgi:flotillin
MLIQQLPQIVKEAAAGLAGANVSVLNGADGLGEIAAGLVGQGLSILESVKRNLGSADSPMPPRAKGSLSAGDAAPGQDGAAADGASRGA